MCETSRLTPLRNWDSEKGKLFLHLAKHYARAKSNYQTILEKKTVVVCSSTHAP